MERLSSLLEAVPGGFPSRQEATVHTHTHALPRALLSQSPVTVRSEGGPLAALLRMNPAWTARTESAPLPREQLLLPSTSKMHIGSKQSSLLSSSQRAPASRAGSTLTSHTEGSRLAASHADILSQSLPQEQTGQFLSPHLSFGIFWWFPLSYKA